MNREKIMPLFWILLGIVISIWSATFPFGRLRNPGPALLPLLCGLVLILLGVILAFQVKRLKGSPSGTASAPLFPRGASGRRVAFTLAAILLSAALLEPLGFAATAFLLILFLMRSIDPQKWGPAVLYAFVTAAGALVLFKFLLQSQLPDGLLGF